MFDLPSQTSIIMSNSQDNMPGGYLDEKMADPIQRSTLLQQHLQRQPYAHLIRAHSFAGGDDDVDDDDEQKHRSKARRRRAHERRRRNGYNIDDDDLSVTSYDSEEEARLAQEEWEESIGQLNLALQVMVLPFFGKWLGRKTSYWREYP